LLPLTSHFITSFKISIFVADHDSCAAKDGLFLYYIDTSSCLLVRLLCFQSCLLTKEYFGARTFLALSTHLHVPLTSHSLHPILAVASIQGSSIIGLG
jgi:hypothetical protein